MAHTDKTITCAGCSKPFIFTAGEQRFYEDKGFQEPKRCQPCREERARRAAAAAEDRNSLARRRRYDTERGGT